MPESEMIDYNQDYSRSTSMVDSRCHSILDRSALRKVDPMKQSLCISMDGSELGDFNFHYGGNIPSVPQSPTNTQRKGSTKQPNQQKIQFFNLKNNLTNNKALDTSHRKHEASTLEDDEYDINRRSRSNELIESEAPKLVSSFDLFQLKDSQNVAREDISLKSNDLCNDNISEDSRTIENKNKPIESSESDEDSLKYIMLQSSKMEQKLEKKMSLVDSQIKSLQTQEQKECHIESTKFNLTLADNSLEID